MSSGRSVGSLDTWQPDDKSFNKHILREGCGELTPNDESVCIVHIISIGTIFSFTIWYFVTKLGLGIRMHIQTTLWICWVNLLQNPTPNLIQFSCFCHQ